MPRPFLSTILLKRNSAFMRSIMLFILLTSSTLSCIAETREPVEFWTDIVSHASVKGIAAAMDDPSSPPWPRIGSAYEIHANPATSGTDADNSLKLADAMRVALGRTFDPEADLNLVNLTRSVDLYLRVAQEFGRAGGYSNWVIRDSIRRIIGLRIADWLIENPTHAASVSPLLEKCLPEKLVLREAFLELSNADEFISKRQDKIKEIEEGMSIFGALQPIDVGFEEVMAVSMSDHLRTSALLNDPSALRLIWRMTNTDFLFKVCLLGSLRFFENGGEKSELNPADIRPFEMRMKGSSRSFQYPLLNIRRLSEAQILYIYSLHENKLNRDLFIEISFK